MAFRQVTDVLGNVGTDPNQSAHDFGQVGRVGPGQRCQIIQAPTVVFDPIAQSHDANLSPDNIVVKRQVSDWPISTVSANGDNIVAMGKREKRKYRPTKIRAWRKAKGFSLEELAPYAEMTPSNLSKVERGDLPYTQHLLEALAAKFRCEPDEILRSPEQAGKRANELDGLSPDDQEHVRAIIRRLKKAA